MGETSRFDLSLSRGFELRNSQNRLSTASLNVSAGESRREPRNVDSRIAGVSTLLTKMATATGQAQAQQRIVFLQ